MSKAKEDMLGCIRKALSGVPEDERPEDIPVNCTYNRDGKLSVLERVKLFVERAGEYQATVQKVEEAGLKKAIAEACKRHDAKNMVFPDDFQRDWIPGGLAPLFDTCESPLSHDELDQSDGVITTCALAIATTGTIILDAGPGQGRRVLTLLPDLHICIVRKDQIVETVPEGFRGVEQKVKDDGRPITFISGPSATSDIELSRVEGVHGPRRLEILVVE